MSIQQYPVRLGNFSYDFPATEEGITNLISEFQRTGLSVVQLGNDLLTQSISDVEYAQRLRQRLEQGGIEIVALAGYRNLVTPNEQKLQTNLEYIRGCLKIAPTLGTTVVATETGTRHPESDWTSDPVNQSPEVWEMLRKVIRELVTEAEKHGSVLALEGYVNNVLATLEQLERMLTEIDSPHLQVVLDPYNYISREQVPHIEEASAQFFQRFKDRFVVAHLKDVAARGAEADTPEFGTGVYPQQFYLDFVRRERPDLPLILEHLPWRHVPAAVERVRALLGTHF